MFLMYAALFALVVISVRLTTHGEFDPFDRYQTTSIKGLFIGMVFVTHIADYVPPEAILSPGWMNAAFRFVRGHFGQLIVVMFLFYSGYGVMTAIMQKGRDYVRTMPTRRIFITLLNFDVAVLLFIVVDLVLGVDLSLKRGLLALTGWTSVGNSNWYIFVIVLCYAIAWLGGVFSRRPLLPIIGLSLILAVVLSLVKESWWYDTLLAFPFGCFVAVHRKRTLEILRRFYLPALFFIVCSFSLLYLLRIKWRVLPGLTHNMLSILFCLFVVVLSVKVKVGGTVLHWMGERLFPIYVYQRIPMLILSSFWGGVFSSELWPVCVLLCVVMTFVIAWAYPLWQIRYSGKDCLMGKRQGISI